MWKKKIWLAFRWVCALLGCRWFCFFCRQPIRFKCVWVFGQLCFCPNLFGASYKYNITTISAYLIILIFSFLPEQHCEFSLFLSPSFYRCSCRFHLRVSLAKVKYSYCIFWLINSVQGEAKPLSAAPLKPWRRWESRYSWREVKQFRRWRKLSNRLGTFYRLLFRVIIGQERRSKQGWGSRRFR